MRTLPVVRTCLALVFWACVTFVTGQDGSFPSFCLRPKCIRKVDIIFVLDGSDSVDPESFIFQLDLVDDIIERITIDALNGFQVGAVVYSTGVTEVLMLQPISSVDFQNKVRNLRHPREGTDTDLGLKEALKQFAENGRKDVLQIIMLITDGKSRNRAKTVAVAKEARSKGIRIEAIGVGCLVDFKELEEITGEAVRVYLVNNYGLLKRLLVHIRDVVCGPEDPSNTTLYSTTPKSSTAITTILSTPTTTTPEISTPEPPTPEPPTTTPEPPTTTTTTPSPPTTTTPEPPTPEPPTTTPEPPTTTTTTPRPPTTTTPEPPTPEPPTTTPEPPTTTTTTPSPPTTTTPEPPTPEPPTTTPEPPTTTTTTPSPPTTTTPEPPTPEPPTTTPEPPTTTTTTPSPPTTPTPEPPTPEPPTTTPEPPTTTTTTPSPPTTPTPEPPTPEPPTTTPEPPTTTTTTPRPPTTTTPEPPTPEPPTTTPEPPTTTTTTPSPPTTPTPEPPTPEPPTTTPEPPTTTTTTPSPPTTTTPEPPTPEPPTTTPEPPTTTTTTPRPPTTTTPEPPTPEPPTTTPEPPTTTTTTPSPPTTTTPEPPTPEPPTTTPEPPTTTTTTPSPPTTPTPEPPTPEPPTTTPEPPTTTTTTPSPPTTTTPEPPTPEPPTTTPEPPTTTTTTPSAPTTTTPEPPTPEPPTTTPEPPTTTTTTPSPPTTTTPEPPTPEPPTTTPEPPTTTTTTPSPPTTPTPEPPTPEPPITTPQPPDSTSDFTPTTTIPVVEESTLTPVTDMPEICRGCIRFQNFGYKGYSPFCNKYVICFFDNNEKFYAVKIRDCPRGMFWNPKALTCDRPAAVNCTDDLCKKGDLKAYPDLGNCRLYWVCRGGRTVNALCCPRGTKALLSQCVPDPTCNDECDDPSPSPGTTIPVPCRYSAVEGKPSSYHERVPGSTALILRKCPPGTFYVQADCLCSGRLVLPKVTECKPDMYLPFDKDTLDHSENLYTVQSRGVTKIVKVAGMVGAGAAEFTGKNWLLVWRYINADLKHPLAIKVRIYETGGDTSGGKELAVMSNNDCGEEPSVDIASTRTVVSGSIHTARRLPKSVNITTTTRVWKDIVYVYNGTHLWMHITESGVEKTASVVVNGNVRRTQCALKIGYGKLTDERVNFVGYIDEIYVYLGCIPEDVKKLMRG